MPKRGRATPPAKPERIRRRGPASRSPKVATPNPRNVKQRPAVASTPASNTPAPIQGQESLESRFQKSIENLDETLVSLAPVLSLLFTTLVAIVNAQNPEPVVPPSAGPVGLKLMGKAVRAHARQCLGAVIKSGRVNCNGRKQSRFAKAIKESKSAAWQRACCDEWCDDNHIDESTREGLHGVSRSLANNLDQVAGDR
jgi:hypothetical protein